MPVMRHIRADEHQIPRVEKLDMIRHKPRPRAALNQRQFRRPMIMPMVSLPLNRPRHPAPNHAYAIHPPRPAEQTERLIGIKSDIFAVNGHQWHDW